MDTDFPARPDVQRRKSHVHLLQHPDSGFTVVKIGTQTSGDHAVTVWLYRTTDSSAVGSVNGDRVPLDEMNPSTYQMATLNSGNSWRETFGTCRNMTRAESCITTTLWR